MLAYGGLLAEDYNFWIEREEGIDNEETPFGIIQSESLVEENNLFFLDYQQLNRAQLDSLAKISFYHSAIFQTSDDEDTLSCYADGSFTPSLKIGGTGIHWTTHPDGSGYPLSISQKYSPSWSSFNCELLAIRDALKSIEAFPPDFSTTKKIVIYTDCLSAISTLAGILKSPWTQSRPQLIVEILNLMISTQTKYSISISWIKGHSGVTGNEMADMLAKSAANKDDAYASQNFIDRSFFTAKARSSGKILPPNGFPNLPSYILREISGQDHPKVGSMIIRILSNHYYLKGCHYNRSSSSRLPGTKRLRKLKSPESLPVTYACRYCSEEPETIEHIVNYCKDSVIEATRFILRGQVWSARPHPPPNTLLQNVLTTPTTWKNLYAFFQNISLSP
jgi:ribonuclease HI